MAPLGPAEEAFLLELNPIGHALRVGGVSVALLGTTTAPQLVLDLNPNRHGPRLVDHVVNEADVIFRLALHRLCLEMRSLCFRPLCPWLTKNMPLALSISRKYTY